jgi:phage gpG-like protein
MIETLEYIRMLDRVSMAVSSIPQRAATLAVNFSKERFRAQNWVDTRTEPWPKRQGREKRKVRAILIDSGRLRRSIRKVVVTSNFVIIGTNVPYAQAHNDGFRGEVTVKQHRRDNRARPGYHLVRSHTKNINLPRRRFIGPSSVLDRQMVRMMTSEIARAMKNV